MICVTTSQIGCMSRKRTNSAESSIARPVENTTSIARISGSSSQLSIGRTPEMSAKMKHDDQVQHEVEERQQHHRERDHQPRELDLAYEVLAVHDAAHRTAGGFSEEREQHDRAQQLHAVELFARLAARAHMADHDEEHVQDAEQQQRPHHLPDVAEHGAEELELEFVARDVVGEVPETPPVLGSARPDP